MPALPDTNRTILITGANGYIASWIVGSLLKKGYIVRAAVRNESRGQQLIDTYRSYGSKLQLYPVGNMQSEGAWDEAVKGVDAIMHTAAQVDLNTVEPADIIEPAVEGVLNILKSTLQYGSSVKRFIYTSTCAAIIDTSEDILTVTEADWNDKRIKEVEEKGKDAHGLTKYSASKTLAEKGIGSVIQSLPSGFSPVIAFWQFYEQHRSEVQWDVVVLNPPWVFGPNAHKIIRPDELNESNRFWFNAVVKGDVFGASPETSPGHGWVDARDVAEAHVLALESPKAGGERIILCAGSPFVWQDFSNPGGKAFRTITFASNKSKELLGLEYRTMEETTRDILRGLE
ncbi:hypothetical protein VNI00_011508 [Paramarasmius palmivorus]|uniref:NAD-dependent epimerase/dehydratase domain-containing protein n=1 Tax=Paramarasmius palmivorus TaxID=297713 RepID=A0AAW0CCX9_9AGAR